MAKQIYIDENGNEQLVSGTINNAEMLPISANDSTNTKDYIDARKSATYSLIVPVTINTTETVYGTYGGRLFSDYDLYIFIFGVSDTDFRRTLVLTKSQWVSGASIDEGVLHGASSSSASAYSYCGITIKYNSDTSVKAKVFGSGTINRFSVIGIKY